MITKKIEYEKLEYIHFVLQEIDQYCRHNKEQSGIDGDLVVTAMAQVEDLREKFFDKDGELIEELNSSTFWNKS